MANYVWTNENQNGNISDPGNYRVYEGYGPYAVSTVVPGVGDAVHVGQEYLMIVGSETWFGAESWQGGPGITIPFDLYIYQSDCPPAGTIFNGKVNYPSENSQPYGLIFNGVLETVNDFMRDCTFNGPVIWTGPNYSNVFEGYSNTNAWNRYLQLGYGGPKLYSLNAPEIPRGGSGPAIGPNRISIGA